MAETGKICPHCGRKISGNAPKCPFCRAKINEAPASEQKQVIKNSRLNALLNGEPEPEEVVGPSPAIEEVNENNSPIVSVMSENETAEPEHEQDNAEKTFVSEPVSKTDKAPEQEPSVPADAPAAEDSEEPEKEVRGRKKKKNKEKKESPRGKRLRTTESDAEDSPVREKKGLFGKKKKEDKKPADEYKNNYQVDEEITYNANSDGYYDDVVPELAEQINRLPTENILRLVFTLIFVIAVVIIALQNF